MPSSDCIIKDCQQACCNIFGTCPDPTSDKPQLKNCWIYYDQPNKAILTQQSGQDKESGQTENEAETEKQSESSQREGGNLSSGVIVGIVIGSVAGLVLLVILILLMIKRYKRWKNKSRNQTPTHEQVDQIGTSKQVQQVKQDNVPSTVQQIHPDGANNLVQPAGQPYFYPKYKQ